MFQPSSPDRHWSRCLLDKNGPCRLCRHVHFPFVSSVKSWRRSILLSAFRKSQARLTSARHPGWPIKGSGLRDSLLDPLAGPVLGKLLYIPDRIPDGTSVRTTMTDHYNLSNAEQRRASVF